MDYASPKALLLPCGARQGSQGWAFRERRGSAKVRFAEVLSHARCTWTLRGSRRGILLASYCGIEAWALARTLHVDEVVAKRNYSLITAPLVGNLSVHRDARLGGHLVRLPVRGFLLEFEFGRACRSTAKGLCERDRLRRCTSLPCLYVSRLTPRSHVQPRFCQMRSQWHAR